MVSSYFQLAHSILIHFCATQKIVQKSFAFGLYSTFTTLLSVPLQVVGSGAPLPPLPWASAAAARRHHCLAAAAHWQPRRRQRRRRRRNPIPAGEAADDVATLPPASAGVRAGLDRRILSGSAALCAELEQ